MKQVYSLYKCSDGATRMIPHSWFPTLALPKGAWCKLSFQEAPTDCMSNRSWVTTWFCENSCTYPFGEWEMQEVDKKMGEAFNIWKHGKCKAHSYVRFGMRLGRDSRVIRDGAVIVLQFDCDSEFKPHLKFLANRICFDNLHKFLMKRKLFFEKRF